MARTPRVEIRERERWVEKEGRLKNSLTQYDDLQRYFLFGIVMGTLGQNQSEQLISVALEREGGTKERQGHNWRP